MQLLSYLIFEVRDLKIIKRYLSQYKDNLKQCSEKEIDLLFSSIFYTYITLKSDDSKKIEYFYNVILLLQKFELYSFYSTSISYDILKASNLDEKEHIVNLKHIFDSSYVVPLEELGKLYNVPLSLDDETVNEAYSFTMNNLGRVNFTHQEVITIDDEQSRCLDDAVYLEKLTNGINRLYIHITDIPSFIPYLSKVSQAAMMRGEDFYLSDMHMTMYPEYISFNICSLLENNNRNVISLIMDFDSNYDYIDNSTKIVKGKINVKHNLTYDSADKIIMQSSEDNSLRRMLINLYKLSLKLQDNNLHKEDYRNLENFLSKKSYHESLLLPTSPSANIIHECMVLLNHVMASYFKENAYPFLYRQASFLNQSLIAEQLKNIEEYDPSILLDNRTKNYLKNFYIESRYIEIPIYHEGLKLDCYSHTSSPARRYADSFCQYLIHEFIFNKNNSDKNIDIWNKKCHNMANYLNERKLNNELFMDRYNYLSYKKLLKKK